MWNSWVKHAAKQRRSVKQSLDTDTDPTEIPQDELSSVLHLSCRMPVTAATVEQLNLAMERSNINPGASCFSRSQKRRKTSGSLNQTNPSASRTSLGDNYLEQYCCRRPMMVEVGLSCSCSCEECQHSQACPGVPASASAQSQK